MECQHKTQNWAAVVSVGGDIFHVCWNINRYVLYPGAPAAGRGRHFTPQNDAQRAFTVVPPGWKPLGW